MRIFFFYVAYNKRQIIVGDTVEGL